MWFAGAGIVSCQCEMRQQPASGPQIEADDRSHPDDALNGGTWEKVKNIDTALQAYKWLGIT